MKNSRKSEVALAASGIVLGAFITGPAAQAAEMLTAQPSHTVALPKDGSKYIPQVGDIILCDDGTDYAITNVSRWEHLSAQ